MPDEVDLNSNGLLPKLSYEFDQDDPSTSSKFLLEEFRPELKARLENEQLRVEIVAGGQTNKLLAVYFGENEEKTLIRVYGIGTEHMIDREGELHILKSLYKLNCSGKIYGLFKNGICYEYVRGDALTWQTICDEDISPLVIQEIVHLHCVQERGEIYPAFGLFDRMRDMLSMMPKCYDDEEKQNKFVKHFPAKETFVLEIDLLEKKLTSNEVNSPLVFCHNDLCCGNIIYDEKSDRVHIIDFEYAGINYQAFDIANHFNEFAGVYDCTYSRFPAREFQLKWLRTYLESWQTFHGETTAVTDDSVQRLYIAVQKFTLASHLFWILWSFVQSQHSTIDFDYLEYARIRYEEYKKWRKDRLALNSASLIS